MGLCYKLENRYVISRNSIVVVSKDQVFCNLAEEVVILALNSGMYFGLNVVGARIWKLIQEPTTVNEVCEVLLEEYDVEHERCEHDLVAILQELVTKGLVEVGNPDWSTA
jgi:hypothetical protein